jgi:autotransporter-associated beta strand protein
MGDYGVEKLNNGDISGAAKGTISAVDGSAGMISLGASDRGPVILVRSIANNDAAPNSASIGVSAGTLTLSGSNTYSSTVSNTGSVMNTSGGILTLAGSNTGTVTLNGSIAYSEAGSVHAGTLTLNGLNTYTGTVVMNTGTLTLSGGTVIVNGAVSAVDRSGF